MTCHRRQPISAVRGASLSIFPFFWIKISIFLTSLLSAVPAVCRSARRPAGVAQPSPASPGGIAAPANPLPGGDGKGAVAVSRMWRRRRREGARRGGDGPGTRWRAAARRWAVIMSCVLRARSCSAPINGQNRPSRLWQSCP